MRAHAWNQPHPGRGRHPRRPPRRHVVLHRPGPHDRRQRPSGRPPRSGSPAPSPAPRRSPTWSTRPSTRSRSTASRRPGDGVRRQPDRADRARRRERAGRPRRLHLLAHRRGPAPVRRPRRRPGLPLLPVRGARRPPRLHDLRAARPQGAVHVHRDRARRTGRSSPTRRAPSPSRSRGWRRRQAVWRFAPTKPMSTYITALVAGEYHEVSYTYDGKHGEIPLGLYCRQSLVEHLDADELVKVTKQGFEFFEEAFDYPYPFGKYDQLFVPEYNMGAMENAGCVTLPRRVPPAQPPGPRVLRVPRRGDPPRDGAHVVRRPGDHEVVGRPLAQRVVRRVGLLPRRRRGHRVHRGLDRLHQRPQELGLPPGPAAQHPPDRRRQLRPAGRRGQLRRHHLRQGRLGAQAARRLGRPGELPRGHPGLLPGLRVRQLRVQGPAGGAGEVLAAASSSPGPRSGCRPRASTPWRRGSSSTPTAPTRRSRCARPRTPTTRPCAGTGSASACTTRSTAGWSAARRSRPTSRASSPRSPSWSGSKQPDLLLLNDGDLAYAKIRLDERSLATVVDEHRDHRRLARPRAVLGRGLGHDPRRRDDARPTSSTLVLVGHRLRDRRVRRQPDPDVRRAGGDRSTPRRPTAPRCGPRWEPGLRELLMTAEPGSDHQLSFARAYAGAAHSDQALADLEGLLDGSLRHRRPRGRHRPALDAAVTALAKNGRADGDRIDEELARDNTISGQEHAAAARALRPTAEAKAEAWEDAMVRDDVANETQRSIVLAFSAYGQDEVLDAVRREVPRPPPTRCGRTRAPSGPRPRWSSSSPSTWPARRCSTGSTPGSRTHRPTRPRSATSARAATTSPAPSGPGQGRPGLSTRVNRNESLPAVVAMRS